MKLNAVRVNFSSRDESFVQFARELRFGNSIVFGDVQD